MKINGNHSESWPAVLFLSENNLAYICTQYKLVALSKNKDWSTERLILHLLREYEQSLDHRKNVLYQELTEEVTLQREETQTKKNMKRIMTTRSKKYIKYPVLLQLRNVFQTLLKLKKEAKMKIKFNRDRKETEINFAVLYASNTNYNRSSSTRRIQV